MLLPCCILILLLLILLILSLPLVSLLVLPLSLIWCSSFFFCICHFSYLYTLLFILLLPLYVAFLPSCKFPAICLLFPKFNSSQMLEIDDPWRLTTIGILSGIVPDEKSSSNSLSSVSILPQAIVIL